MPIQFRRSNWGKSFINNPNVCTIMCIVCADQISLTKCWQSNVFFTQSKVTIYVRTFSVLEDGLLWSAPSYGRQHAFTSDLFALNCWNTIFKTFKVSRLLSACPIINEKVSSNDWVLKINVEIWSITNYHSEKSSDQRIFWFKADEGRTVYVIRQSHNAK